MSDLLNDQNKIMELKLDETSGTIAADTSPYGSNNFGTLINGAAFQEVGGEFVSVVNLDGKDDYILVNDSKDLNRGTHHQRTVSVWFRVDDKNITSKKQLIYEEGGGAKGLNIYINQGKLYVGGWNEPETGWLGTFLSTDKIESNTWHHVALVLNSTQGLQKTQAGALVGYLDGEEFGSGLGSQLGNRTTVGIGGVNGSTKFHDGNNLASNGLAGSIDNLKVYNRVLSAAEIIQLASATPPGAPNQSGDDELIMQLKLDETSGTIAPDTSPYGSNNFGTLKNGAAFQEVGGDFVSIVNFDGKDDWIQVNDSKDLNLSNHHKRTVSVWFRVEDKNTTSKKQLIYEEGGGSKGLNIYIDKGKLYVGGWNEAESGWLGTFLATDQIQSNTWHHVALVLNATEGLQKTQAGALVAYLDGQEFGSGEGSQLWSRTTVGIGGVNGATKFHDGNNLASNSLAGSIDNLKVYNRVLNASEIVELATATPPEPPNQSGDDQLIMELKLDETSGTIATDTSPYGSNNFGTLKNGAAFQEVEGEFVSIVNFDGKDDWIQVNDSQDLNLGNHHKRTVSVWFRVEDKNTTSKKQLIYEEGGGSKGLNIYIDKGKLYVGGWNEAESGWLGTFLATDQIQSNTWHHVALVLNATEGLQQTQAGALVAYLDGQEFGSGEGSQLWSRTTVGIGGVNGATKFHDGNNLVSNSLAGSIDNLKVYNRVLNASEIVELATATPPEPPNQSGDDQLIMELKLDETSGTIAADTSPYGSNNFGTLKNGAVFRKVLGEFGSVVDFDGKNDYIHVNDSQDLNLGNHHQRTVSVWFKVDEKNITSKKQLIYEEGGSSKGLNIYVHNGKLYVGGWNKAESGWSGTFLATDKIVSNTWHNVALVLNATEGLQQTQAGALVAYLDGEEFASGEGSQLWGRGDDLGIAAVNGNTQFHDGNSSSTNGLEGSIDNLKVYNRVLSAEEIQNLAQIKPPPTSEPWEDEFIMHLKLDENSGTNATDSSPYGSNNIGTLQNGAAFRQIGGAIGNIVDLDGENDYVHVNDSPDLNTGIYNQRTVSVWFKADDKNISNRKQVIYEEGGNTNGLNIYVHNGKLYVGGWDIQGNWSGTFLDTDKIQSNTWHNVTLVLNATQGALVAYLDGEQFGSGLGLQLPSHDDDIGIGGLNQTTKFHDGDASGSGSNGLAGSIGDVRVYNRALYPEEVELLAAKPRELMPMELGTNLYSITDWSTQLPLLDGFKSSRPWLTQNNDKWNTQETNLLDLDENGWVKSLPAPEDSPEYTHVGTLLFREIAGKYPGGKYVVLYDGEGTIEYGFNAVKDVAASTPGRDVINVTPNNMGVYLKITSTDPKGTGDYIRDIKVIQESSENTYGPQIFNQAFIDKVNDFEVFRFMDWMYANDSTQGEWSDRPTPETARFSGKMGMPVEIMVELANQTNTDPWFNIPHKATEEYITEFAEYVRDNLDPDLKVYVEYSNEVWNTLFSQGSWVQQQAINEWPNSAENNYTLRLDWFSKRTTEITRIWDNVFGAEKDRVVGVMAAQAGNITTGTRALSYAWDPNPQAHKAYGIDAIAIAPYFGDYLGSPDNEAEVKTWTVDQVFDELTQGGVLSKGPAGGGIKQAYKDIAAYAELAELEDLDLIAYEGGQHLAGKYGVENNQTITDLFIAANRDPRMGEIYDEYFRTWHMLGGGLFANFSDIGRYDKWGSWGALEYVDQKSSPKYDAITGLFDKTEIPSFDLSL